MTIKPLPKGLYDKAKSVGVSNIKLLFSGGSDEGYLNVVLDDGDGGDQDLQSAIEDWAWKVYSYNGAGDGSDYGDDIVYDLSAKTVQHSEWFMERKDGDVSTDKFEVVEDSVTEDQDKLKKIAQIRSKIATTSDAARILELSKQLADLLPKL